MSNYRTQDRTVCVKVEPVAGTDAVPVVGTDAMTCISPRWTGGPQAIPNDDEISGGLDTGGPVPGGGGGGFTCSVAIKGSGTGGTAPEFGPSLRAAALAETLTTPAITGTAQGGAAASITLAAGASADNDLYKGMVIAITGGTGSGQTRVVTGYDGTSKAAAIYPDWTTPADATSEYTIHPNALYVPASDDTKTVSLYDYQHRNSGNSRLRRLLGACCNAEFTLPVRGRPTVALTFAGKFTKPTDVSRPALPTLDTTKFRPVMGMDVSLNGVATKFNQVTFTLGNQVSQADDPSDEFGIDVGAVTRRTITGRINPPLDLLSVRDVWTDFLDGTPRKLWLRWGSTAGNRVSILFPEIYYTGQESEDINNFAHEGIPFSAPVVDSGVFVCFY